MKNLIALLSILLVANFAFAQKNDTTKIRIGDNKILIIKEKKGSKKLENTKMEFKADLMEIEGKISKLNEQKAQTTDESEKQKIETEIVELEKQKAAIQKGIEDVEKDIVTKKKEEKELDELDDDDFQWNHFPFNRKKDRFNGHWAAFEVGLNNYVNKDFNLDMPANGEFMEINTGRSWAFNLNIFEQNIRLHQQYAGFVTGIGFEWNNYTFKEDFTLIESGENGFITANYEPEKDFKVNKLNTTYVTVPLILEFQIPVGSGKTRFHFGGGVIGGMKIYSDTRQEYKLDGQKYENKVKDDYQLSPFRYGATFRIGYGFLHLFANYNITPLFEKNKGPELHPLTIGLTVLNF